MAIRSAIRLAISGLLTLLSLSIACGAATFSPRLMNAHSPGACTSESSWSNLAWNLTYSGGPMPSTSGMRLAFDEEWNGNDVTTDNGAGPWYAPVQGQFGDAIFIAPGQAPLDTYTISGNTLTIRQQLSGGSWYTGTIQTNNSKSQGFSFRYGLAMAQIKFAPNCCSWDSFWTTSFQITNPTPNYGEIDAPEAFGAGGSKFFGTNHYWPAGQTDPNCSSIELGIGYVENTALVGVPNIFDGNFHTYWYSVDPFWIKEGVDGVEIARFPTYMEATRPKYLILSNALRTTVGATSPNDMIIGSIKVYE